jgi:hypothetical protein
LSKNQRINYTKIKIKQSLQNTQVQHDIFKHSEIEDTIDRILENHEVRLSDVIYLLESQEIQRLGLVTALERICLAKMSLLSII